MLFATTPAAMLHSTPLLAAWPWVVMAIHDIDGVLANKIAGQISKDVVDKLVGRLGVARQRHRGAVDKALALETVRRGLTPATTTAHNAWGDHRMNLHRTKQALDVAKKERDELREAARAAEQRVRDAQAVYTTTLRERDQTGQADKEARHARRCELRRARAEMLEALGEARKAERVLAQDLLDVYRWRPCEETVVALAELLGAPVNELMVLMGLRTKRQLNAEEQEAIIRRMMAGEPVNVLAEEYHISRWHAYRMLQEHSNKQCRAQEGPA